MSYINLNLTQIFAASAAADTMKAIERDYAYAYARVYVIVFVVSLIITLLNCIHSYISGTRTCYFFFSTNRYEIGMNKYQIHAR